jgi:hypothetical protein
MRTLKICLVALLALVVGALPISAAMAQAAMSTTTVMSMSGDMPDCCPEPCHNKASDKCSTMAGCALKCFNYSGFVPASGVPGFFDTKVRNLAAGGPRFLAAAITPPLPPPRV